jgi:hypothetical protein
MNNLQSEICSKCDDDIIIDAQDGLVVKDCKCFATLKYVNIDATLRRIKNESRTKKFIPETIVNTGKSPVFEKR